MLAIFLSVTMIPHMLLIVNTKVLIFALCCAYGQRGRRLFEGEAHPRGTLDGCEWALTQSKLNDKSDQKFF